VFCFFVLFCVFCTGNFVGVLLNLICLRWLQHFLDISLIKDRTVFDTLILYLNMHHIFHITYVIKNHLKMVRARFEPRSLWLERCWWSIGRTCNKFWLLLNWKCIFNNVVYVMFYCAREILPIITCRRPAENVCRQFMPRLRPFSLHIQMNIGDCDVYSQILLIVLM